MQSTHINTSQRGNNQTGKSSTQANSLNGSNNPYQIPRDYASQQAQLKTFQYLASQPHHLLSYININEFTNSKWRNILQEKLQLYNHLRQFDLQESYIESNSHYTFVCHLKMKWNGTIVTGVGVSKSKKKESMQFASFSLLLFLTIDYLFEILKRNDIHPQLLQQPAILSDSNSTSNTVSIVSTQVGNNLPQFVDGDSKSAQNVEKNATNLSNMGQNSNSAHQIDQHIDGSIQAFKSTPNSRNGRFHNRNLSQVSVVSNALSSTSTQSSTNSQQQSTNANNQFKTIGSLSNRASLGGEEVNNTNNDKNNQNKANLNENNTHNNTYQIPIQQPFITSPHNWQQALLSYVLFGSLFTPPQQRQLSMYHTIADLKYKAIPTQSIAQSLKILLQTVCQPGDAILVQYPIAPHAYLVIKLMRLKAIIIPFKSPDFLNVKKDEEDGNQNNNGQISLPFIAMNSTNSVPLCQNGHTNTHLSQQITNSDVYFPTTDQFNPNFPSRLTNIYKNMKNYEQSNNEQSNNEQNGYFEKIDKTSLSSVSPPLYFQQTSLEVNYSPVIDTLGLMTCLYATRPKAVLLNSTLGSVEMNEQIIKTVMIFNHFNQKNEAESQNIIKNEKDINISNFNINTMNASLQSIPSTHVINSNNRQNDELNNTENNTEKAIPEKPKLPPPPAHCNNFLKSQNLSPSLKTPPAPDPLTIQRPLQTKIFVDTTYSTLLSNFDYWLPFNGPEHYLITFIRLARLINLPDVGVDKGNCNVGDNKCMNTSGVDGNEDNNGSNTLTNLVRSHSHIGNVNSVGNGSKNDKKADKKYEKYEKYEKNQKDDSILLKSQSSHRQRNVSIGSNGDDNDNIGIGSLGHENENKINKKKEHFGENKDKENKDLKETRAKKTDKNERNFEIQNFSENNNIDIKKYRFISCYGSTRMVLGSNDVGYIYTYPESYHQVEKELKKQVVNIPPFPITILVKTMNYLREPPVDSTIPIKVSNLTNCTAPSGAKAPCEFVNSMVYPNFVAFGGTTLNSLMQNFATSFCAQQKHPRLRNVLEMAGIVGSFLVQRNGNNLGGLGGYHHLVYNYAANQHQFVLKLQGIINLIENKENVKQIQNGINFDDKNNFDDKSVKNQKQFSPNFSPDIHSIPPPSLQNSPDSTQERHKEKNVQNLPVPDTRFSNYFSHVNTTGPLLSEFYPESYGWYHTRTLSDLWVIPKHSNHTMYTIPATSLTSFMKSSDFPNKDNPIEDHNESMLCNISTRYCRGESPVGGSNGGLFGGDVGIHNTHHDHLIANCDGDHYDGNDKENDREYFIYQHNINKNLFGGITKFPVSIFNVIFQHFLNTGTNFDFFLSPPDDHCANFITTQDLIRFRRKFPLPSELLHSDMFKSGSPFQVPLFFEQNDKNDKNDQKVPSSPPQSENICALCLPLRVNLLSLRADQMKTLQKHFEIVSNEIHSSELYLDALEHPNDLNHPYYQFLNKENNGDGLDDSHGDSKDDSKITSVSSPSPSRPSSPSRSISLADLDIQSDDLSDLDIDSDVEDIILRDERGRIESKKALQSGQNIQHDSPMQRIRSNTGTKLRQGISGDQDELDIQKMYDSVRSKWFIPRRIYTNASHNSSNVSNIQITSYNNINTQLDHGTSSSSGGDCGNSNFGSFIPTPTCSTNGNQGNIGTGSGVVTADGDGENYHHHNNNIPKMGGNQGRHYGNHGVERNRDGDGRIGGGGGGGGYRDNHHNDGRNGRDNNQGYSKYSQIYQPQNPLPPIPSAGGNRLTNHNVSDGYLHGNINIQQNNIQQNNDQNERKRSQTQHVDHPTIHLPNSPSVAFQIKNTSTLTQTVPNNMIYPSTLPHYPQESPFAHPHSTTLPDSTGILYGGNNSSFFNPIPPQAPSIFNNPSQNTLNNHLNPHNPVQYGLGHDGSGFIGDFFDAGVRSHPHMANTAQIGSVQYTSQSNSGYGSNGMGSMNNGLNQHNYLGVGVGDIGHSTANSNINLAQYSGQQQLGHVGHGSLHFSVRSDGSDGDQGQSYGSFYSHASNQSIQAQQQSIQGQQQRGGSNNANGNDIGPNSLLNGVNLGQSGQSGGQTQNGSQNGSQNGEQLTGLNTRLLSSPWLRMQQKQYEESNAFNGVRRGSQLHSQGHSPRGQLNHSYNPLNNSQNNPQQNNPQQNNNPPSLSQPFTPNPHFASPTSFLPPHLPSSHSIESPSSISSNPSKSISSPGSTYQQHSLGNPTPPPPPPPLPSNLIQSTQLSSPFDSNFHTTPSSNMNIGPNSYQTQTISTAIQQNNANSLFKTAPIQGSGFNGMYQGNETMFGQIDHINGGGGGGGSRGQNQASLMDYQNDPYRTVSNGHYPF
jgi:hypothetical protein